MSKRKIVVIGGGAAGFFAAITCAEAAKNSEVMLLEATAHLLAKVRVSGGGRCNVTHACFDPRELVKRYPRGSRELLGAFNRWQPSDTVAWFESRGVALKTESDGRMFPATDRSETIVEALLGGARKAGVIVRERCTVKSIERGLAGDFILQLVSGETLRADALLLATGGGKSSAGFSIAQQLGHTIEPLAPSLFTFNIIDPRLKDLPGISVLDTEASIPTVGLREKGPVLVTHWGLSGPAILRLSAWGARDLQACDYRFSVQINWAGGLNIELVKKALAELRIAHPRRSASGDASLGIPQRLWESLCRAAGIAPQTTWSALSRPLLQQLGEQISASSFSVTGKSTNKEEFVTCGGVRLSEVDFKTMQSRLCKGLFFAGEVLDIDGITGGFNFQAAWTAGRLAGQAMADFSL